MAEQAETKPATDCGQPEEKNTVSKILLTKHKMRAIGLRLDGKSDTEIAAILKVDKSTICRWFAQMPEEIIGECATDAKLGIANMLDGALAVIEESFTSEDESIRLKAAELALKSVGVIRPAQMKVDNSQHTNVTITNNEKADIAKGAASRLNWLEIERNDN